MQTPLYQIPSFFSDLAQDGVNLLAERNIVQTSANPAGAVLTRGFSYGFVAPVNEDVANRLYYHNSTSGVSVQDNMEFSWSPSGVAATLNIEDYVQYDIPSVIAGHRPRGMTVNLTTAYTISSFSTDEFIITNKSNGVYGFHWDNAAGASEFSVTTTGGRHGYWGLNDANEPLYLAGDYGVAVYQTGGNTRLHHFDNGGNATLGNYGNVGIGPFRGNTPLALAHVLTGNATGMLWSFDASNYRTSLDFAFSGSVANQNTVTLNVCNATTTGKTAAMVWYGDGSSSASGAFTAAGLLTMAQGASLAYSKSMSFAGNVVGKAFNLLNTGNVAQMNTDGYSTAMQLDASSIQLQANSHGATTCGGTLSASNLSGTNTGDQTLPTLSSLGAVSTGTTVNGYALTSNVTVTASDVGLGSSATPTFASLTLSGSSTVLTLGGNGTLQAANIVPSSSGGIKFGGSGTDKLGAFGTAPIAQLSGSLLTAMGTASGYGWVSSPTISYSEISGASGFAPLTGAAFTGQVIAQITSLTNSQIVIKDPSGIVTNTVTNKVLTSNVATLTIGMHALAVDQVVAVSGVDSTFNGTFALSAVTGTTISYRLVHADVGSQASSGSVIGQSGPGLEIQSVSGRIKFTNTSDSGQSFQLYPNYNLGASFPIPTLAPTTANTGIAFDIVPRGSPSNNGITGAVCWIDILNQDYYNQRTNYEGLRLGSGTTYHQVSAAFGGTGAVRPLVLNVNGGQVGIGVLPYSSGGLLCVTKNNVYTSENAGITIDTGTNAQPELLLGADNTNTIAYIQSAARGTSFTAVPLAIQPNGGNISLIGLPSMGGAVGAVFVANATTVPTSNPTGGGILFTSAGALKYRGSSGTITTLAAA